MMKYFSQNIKQLTLDTFRSSLESLPKDNRWIKIADSLPWQEIENLYNARLNNMERGAGNKPARMIIGALIIKHRMVLSDDETIEAIRENPYMQYLCGLSEFTDKPIFDGSLFTTIRKRLDNETFNGMSESMLNRQLAEARRKKAEGLKSSVESEGMNNHEEDGSGTPPPQESAEEGGEVMNKGTLKIDATCSDAEVRYPTDLDLLEDGCRIMDRTIGRFCRISGQEKPATHYKATRSIYLNVIKLRNKPKQKVRWCMEVLLAWLRRNIEMFWGLVESEPYSRFFELKKSDRRLFFAIIDIYRQQKAMFKAGVHTCRNRIISIFQPHVRPIVRGKSKAKVEFGAKIGVSVVEGYTFVDHHSWDAYNEGEDLKFQVELYKERWGFYPARLEGDRIYMNRANRIWLNTKNIEAAGKPLGRPPKEAREEDYRKKMAKFIGERNEVEATFGTGKRVYKANNIRAKLSQTAESWNAACYFVKNVMKFLRDLLHVLIIMVRNNKILSKIFADFGNIRARVACRLFMTLSRS